MKPPCISSLVTSCTESPMASSSDEGKTTTPFTEGVSSSAKVELAIDEIASTVSSTPNLCVVPDLSVVVRREKSVCDLLDILSGQESTHSRQILGGEADDDDGFVDIMIVSLHSEMLSQRV